MPHRLTQRQPQGIVAGSIWDMRRQLKRDGVHFGAKNQIC
jgi:hypothetical protein